MLTAGYAERLCAFEGEVAQGFVVDPRGADERGHAVGIARPSERRRAHHVQMVAQDHDGARGLPRAPTEQYAERSRGRR